MENTEYKADSKFRLGRPAKWNRVFNNCIRAYFEGKQNIVSCHMAWVVVENQDVPPHFILCIRANPASDSIGSELVDYCNSEMREEVPLTDIIYDKGDPISKMVRVFGKRIYPRRRFWLF